MTSNVGAHKFEKRSSVGFSQADDTQTAVMSELKKMYAPELINRFDEVIVFDKLTDDDLLYITKQLIQQLRTKVRKNTGKRVVIDDQVISYVLNQCDDTDLYGARPIKRSITRTIETPLANHLIQTQDKTVTITVENDKIQIK